MNKVHETLKKHILIDDEAIVVDLEKSQGSWLTDADGKTYLDCFSQFASQPLGWNHPKVLARKDRLLKAAIHKVANSDMYTQAFADFVETFANFTTDFKYHFYISGGALAVENAMKTAFDWKYKTANMNETHKLSVMHLKGAFHGRSGYTLSVTNTGLQKTGMKDMKDAQGQPLVQTIQNLVKSLEAQKGQIPKYQSQQATGGYQQGAPAPAPA